MTTTENLPTLTTERMTLTQLCEHDLGDIVAMNAQPAVTRYLNGGKPIAADASEEWIAANVAWGWTGHLRTPDEHGSFVGFFATRPTSPNERELGYRLPAHRWGSGFASEGSKAIVEHAFVSMHCERVWAQTMTVNRGSRRVMEKTGLEFVGMLDLVFDEPIEGSEFGDVEYGITRDQWRLRL